MKEGVRLLCDSPTVSDHLPRTSKLLAIEAAVHLLYAEHPVIPLRGNTKELLWQTCVVVVACAVRQT